MRPPSRARSGRAWMSGRGKIGKTCPTCEAKPGQSCGRWKDLGGMKVWHVLVTFHHDR